MAEKLNLTRAQALEIAGTLLTAANMENYRPEGLENADYTTAIAVISRMSAQLTKPRKAVESKVHVQNRNLAKWVYQNVKDDNFSSKDIVNLGNPTILTTQKATAVLRVGVEQGYFTLISGKRVAYAKKEGANLD